jgi:hypothetical protein
MMSSQEQLNNDIIRLKAIAYDILANMEFLTADFKAKIAQFQKQLEDTNKDISTKDTELRQLLLENKE